MSEPAEDSIPTENQTASPSFSDTQRLHLRVSCEYMDKMLQQMEAILHAQESASPFSRYQMDLSPAQARVMEDYIRRFRSQILRTLAWQQIQLPPPEIPVTRAITTHLLFVDNAISELRPYAMRGSGPVSETTAAELTGILGELSSIVGQMLSYVKQDLAESLEQRIEKISGGGDASQLLQRVEKVVTGQGLVEFRPRIDLLLARLENPSFEVAVFGRVSAGKSSFLNTLLEADLLPVGVNPITAVPTRIQHGTKLDAAIRMGNKEPVEVSLDQFRKLISEAGNPGNQAGVRQATLRTPAARLAEGIVLVDTPGLGSLALRGARETLAYLPSCDLALLLIDAGNTLTLEDIGTLRLLQQAAIPTLVLLSKADLLREPDRDASVQYIKAQIQEQLRMTVPVHAISSVPENAATIDRFYGQELQPRFQQAHSLRLKSVQTKLFRLQADVLASLEAKRERADAAPSIDTTEMERLQRLLLDAAGRIGTIERTLEERALHLGFEAPEFLAHVAEEMPMTHGGTSLQDVTTTLRGAVQSKVEKVVEQLQAAVSESVLAVRNVGDALQRGSLPDEKEIAGLIRDAPRFEMPEIEGSVDSGQWKLLGERAARHKLLRSLQAELELMLKKELGIYSASLGFWLKNVIRNVQFAVNSYAEAYRVALQEAGGAQRSTQDTAQIQRDIAMLKATE